MTDSIENKLKVLQDEVANCVKCDLCKTRTQTVFARGNPRSYITIVGESPGQNEDLQGIPFVGRSGNVLDKTLTEAGLDVSKDIYVCNIIKCRPPKNRKPTEEECNTCIDYLEEQLNIVSPKIIVALGNTALSGLLPFDGGITKLHGKFFKRGDILVMPCYHPSYVLRNGSSGPIYNEFKQDLQSAINKTKE
jgi:uracil-DNA glycosylase family 4